MARSTPSVVLSTPTGAVATPTAPNADGDIVPVGSRLLVQCGATGTTVTIQTPGTQDGLAIAEAGGAVAANSARWFGPFTSRAYKQASDAPVGPGAVLVDYSSIVTVTRVLLG